MFVCAHTYMCLQVSGTGQVYKRSWWNPWAGDTPQRPAITGEKYPHEGLERMDEAISVGMRACWPRHYDR